MHGVAGGHEREGQNLVEVFRRLYFHLYANSPASRAERIVGDLSLLLLVKFADDLEGPPGACARFLEGSLDGPDLIDHARGCLPGLVDDTAAFNLDAASLRRALADLAPVSLAGSPAHVLGDAFQAVMGPRLRGERGQFFTPRSLVRAMVEVLDPQPGEAVLDPACGTGGFLREAYAHVAGRHGPEAAASLSLAGVEKDADLARLSSALLAIATRGRAGVRNANALDPLAWPAGGAGATYDVVLTNPPFGARIGVTDPRILGGFALGHQWRSPAGGRGWTRTAALQRSQDPQTLFLNLCVERLKPGGRLGIVLPEGLFGNRRAGYIWDWLAANGRIIGLLDCPRTTFQPGTDTKTNVLFFQRGAPPGAGPASTRVAVALTCGHDRRGRDTLPDGTARPSDLDEIGSDFHRDGSSRYWQDVVLARPYYLVPRYYERAVAATQQERLLVADARRAPLGELRDDGVVWIRKGHEPGSDAYGTGEVPFVRTSDLADYEVRSDPTKAVSLDVYERYAPHQRLAPGDVLLVADGRYRIGVPAILTDRTSRCVVQSHLRVLTCLRPEVVGPYDLLYALTLPSVRRRIRDLVFVQSTLGTLGPRLLELELPLLGGDGPWREAVDRFAAVLRERDRLLASLAEPAASLEL